MRRACAVIVLWLGGCFSTDPGNRRFPCDESHGCPPGQSCQNKVCQEDGTAPLDAGIDLAANLDMTIVRCAGNGYPIGTKGVLACLGAFTPAKPASSLCANGKLCTDISTLVSKQECDSAPNGLVGVAGQGTGSLDAKCAPSSGLLMWFGCGVRSSPLRSEPAPNPCRGHTQVHFCSTSGIVCNMSDLRLDAQTNTDANTGVLCCP